MSDHKDLPHRPVLPKTARGEQREQRNLDPRSVRFHLSDADGNSPAFSLEKWLKHWNPECLSHTQSILPWLNLLIITNHFGEIWFMSAAFILFVFRDRVYTFKKQMCIHEKAQKHITILSFTQLCIQNNKSSFKPFFIFFWWDELVNGMTSVVIKRTFKQIHVCIWKRARGRV